MILSSEWTIQRLRDIIRTKSFDFRIIISIFIRLGGRGVVQYDICCQCLFSRPPVRWSWRIGWTAYTPHVRRLLLDIGARQALFTYCRQVFPSPSAQRQVFFNIAHNIFRWGYRVPHINKLLWSSIHCMSWSLLWWYPHLLRCCDDFNRDSANNNHEILV